MIIICLLFRLIPKIQTMASIEKTKLAHFKATAKRNLPQNINSARLKSIVKTIFVVVPGPKWLLVTATNKNSDVLYAAK